MENERSGFEEIEHTADWAIRVWAPDLPGLFTACAVGLYSLTGIVIAQGKRQEHSFELNGIDVESLLVIFLSELVYYAETQNLAFDRFELDLSPDRLKAAAYGAEIIEQSKEVKAVTFQGMQICQQDGLWQVTVVFDV
jgi:SHS2 domain-containing protein